MFLAFYTLIVFVATTLGASAGIGGGIIIKPAFDLLNQDELNIISFLSANAVFFMALYSSVKRLRGKAEKFDKPILLIIALSSIVGGFVGNEVFYYLFDYIDSNNLKSIQSIALCVIVVFLITYFTCYKKFKSLHLKSKLMMFIIGFVLGFVSSFLSIGGGPLNVALYTLLFGFSLKLSVAYSIATIFFAQGTQLLNILLTQDISTYPLSYLLAIVPTAIAGGIVGQCIYKRLNDRAISIILSATMLVVLCMNVSNLIMSMD